MAIQKSPFAGSNWIWGALLFGVAIFLDSDGLLIGSIGFALWDYVVSPKFECQYCDKKIVKESYR